MLSDLAHAPDLRGARCVVPAARALFDAAVDALTPRRGHYESAPAVRYYRRAESTR